MTQVKTSTSIKRRAGSTPAIDRIYARMVVHPLGCWEWTGAHNEEGYGVIQMGRGLGTDRTHRVVYREEIGPIPDGLTLDHLCLNSRCFNPVHLEPVTRAENTRRQWAAGRSNAGIRQSEKTHCPQGHAYDDANTYVARGRRSCRTCARDRARITAAKRLTSR